MSKSDQKEQKNTTANTGGRERPLSPHLSIYKPQITSVLSICHRATGVFNSIGLVLITMWLSSLAAGGECYSWFVDIAGSALGQLAILAWTFSMFYHLCNGIRHLAWDLGYGFELDNVTKSGIAVLVVATALTAITFLGII